MKAAIVPAVVSTAFGLAMLASVPSGAQQPPAGNPANSRVVQAPPSERVVPVDVQRQGEPRSSDRKPTEYQMLEFAFATGDDDLRDDSTVVAGIIFPDGTRQICQLHGRDAVGAGANVSWDNHSKHMAPPCHLEKPWRLNRLREARVTIGMFGPGHDPNLAAAVFGGPIGLAATLRSPDNWNINEAAVWAYNPGIPGKVCVISVGGNPVARLTGDQPRVRLTDYPNRCH